MSWALAPRSLPVPGPRRSAPCCRPPGPGCSGRAPRGSTSGGDCGSPSVGSIRGCAHCSVHCAHCTHDAHNVRKKPILYADRERCSQEAGRRQWDAEEEGPVRRYGRVRSATCSSGPQPGRDRPRGDRDAGRGGRRRAQHAQARCPARRGATSLYRHVATKDELMELAVDEVFGRSPCRPPGTPTGGLTRPGRLGRSGRRRCATLGGFGPRPGGLAYLGPNLVALPTGWTACSSAAGYPEPRGAIDTCCRTSSG